MMETLLELYLGGMNRISAEQLLVRPTTFALYHRFPTATINTLDKLTPKIPLFIVYKTSHSVYW